MNKEGFLKELESHLRVLDDKEQQDILDEYAQHIDLKMKSGLSEEEAIRDLAILESWRRIYWRLTMWIRDLRSAGKASQSASRIWRVYPRGVRAGRKDRRLACWDERLHPSYVGGNEKRMEAFRGTTQEACFKRRKPGR